MNYWAADSFSFTFSQKITGLADGEYVLKAWAAGGERANTVRNMYVVTGGVTTTTAIAKTAWNAWEQYTIGSISVTDGQATIGFEVINDESAEEWGNFDDIEFYKVEQVPTWNVSNHLAATNVTATSLTLAWSGVNNAASVIGYKVYKNGILHDSLPATTTSLNITELLPDTEYMFKVEAGNNSDIWSVDGPATTVTTTTTTATAPSWATDAQLTASSLTSRGVVLSWSEKAATDETGVTKYRIYQNGAVKATVSGSTYSYQSTELSPGTSYTFKIQAGNEASLWSVNGPSVSVNTPEVAASDFIKGADISTLQAIEDAGGKYYENGVERDLLAILKDNGVNYVRLRLWNNPVQADGYNDKAHTVAMAKRVKAAGLKLLLDFHYSDFWADPGSQVKPEAWKNLSFTELNDAVYAYTAEVMSSLKAENAYPDMVQIGNEINPGMLLPEGAISNYNKLAQLLGNGIKAVRDTTPAGHEVKIMIHLAEGGDNEKFRSFFDEMKVRNVDYDVIGLSFYPYWHGTFKQLKDNLNDLAVRFGKELIVVETAHPYTLEDGDGWGDIAKAADAEKAGFPATPQGQADSFTMVMNTVAHTTGGKGVGAFYWEPAWIPVPKDENGDYQAGWKTKEGNAWDNQAMFDFKGNALSSLKAFGFDATRLPVKEMVSVRPLEGITVPANEPSDAVAAMLPTAVGILYNEGSIEQSAVTWQYIDQDQLSRIGKFTLIGTVAGTKMTAKIEITVTSYRNLVTNPGFEADSTATGWTVTGTTAAAKVETNASNASSGQRALNYWYGSDYSFKVSQTIEGLRDGMYTMKARISGEDPKGQPSSIHLFVESDGHDKLTSKVVNKGWNNWSTYIIENIEVTNGKAIIGVEVDAPANAWGYFDDFEFYEQVTVPEWTSAANLSASELSSNSLKLNWTGLADPGSAAGYKIYRDGILLMTVSGTAQVITGLKPNTQYTFKVEASADSSIWTSNGPYVTVTTSSDYSPVIIGGTSGASTKQEVITLQPQELTGGVNGRKLVELPAGTTEIRLPINASGLLGRNRLALSNDEISLDIPASVLAQLGELAGAGDGYLSIRLEPLAASSAWFTRVKEHTAAEIQSFGTAFDFWIVFRREGWSNPHNI